MEQDIHRKVHPREYLKRFVDKDVRPDGRGPSTSRTLRMTNGSISPAVGSALVKLGSTTVLAGVTATLVAPDYGSPEKGVFEVLVDIVSTATANFRSARAEESQILTEYLHTLVSPSVDLSALCVKKEKLVWHLKLNVYCIDHDGNLEDSIVLAALAALRDVRLPTVRMIDDTDAENDENGRTIDKMVDDADQNDESNSLVAVVSSSRSVALELQGFPLPVSFQLFCGKALIDPSVEEEKVCASRITFLMRPSGELKGVLKPGGMQISQELYNSCFTQARRRTVEYVKKLEIN